MNKGKGPRKRKPSDEQHIEAQKPERAELVPPSRQLPRAERNPVPERLRPALFHFVEAIRLAAAALLDLADEAVDTIRKGIEGRP